MGRDCGWLTAATAAQYRQSLEQLDYAPEIGVSKDRLDVRTAHTRIRLSPPTAYGKATLNTIRRSKLHYGIEEWPDGHG